MVTVPSGTRRYDGGDMATTHDCSDASALLSGMRLARAALGRGELVVMPTDTVYGVAADAFNPAGVRRLLDAKGRGRQSPPPVLIPGIPTLDALAAEVPPEARALVEAFWPGGLTIILPARDSLRWDLGDTGGTVALRMPANPVALELLAETGPLAVSSANLTGEPAAVSVDEARRMLGESVAVYLDDGPGGTAGSTIVDATGLSAGVGVRIVRQGTIPDEAIHAAIRDAVGTTRPDADAPGMTAPDTGADDESGSGA